MWWYCHELRGGSHPRLSGTCGACLRVYTGTYDWAFSSRQVKYTSAISHAASFAFVLLCLLSEFSEVFFKTYTEAWIKADGISHSSVCLYVNLTWIFALVIAFSCCYFHLNICKIEKTEIRWFCFSVLLEVLLVQNSVWKHLFSCFQYVYTWIKQMHDMNMCLCFTGWREIHFYWEMRQPPLGYLVDQGTEQAYAHTDQGCSKRWSTCR